MMSFSTPGVYVREITPLRPKLVRLGITGFVGQAESGSLNEPQEISGWEEFQRIFGSFVEFSFLPYAIFGFFLNGGERCFIVRVSQNLEVPSHRPLTGGLTPFEAISEIGAIAIPDLALLEAEDMAEGQRDMLRHCEKMGDRFAILDCPRGAKIGVGEKIEDWPLRLQQQHSSAKYGALYYPWIKGRGSDFAGRDLIIPPSGHVAGIYARSESTRGIQKAPANEVLRGVVELEIPVSDAEQDLLNPKGINCLRAFPGRGIRVWGARTLSLDPSWRYVNVRRICLSIIKQIGINLQSSVFEPNDRRLRDRIVAIMTLLLRDLFQNGALAGTNPAEAFFVKCDEENNPAEVVELGQLITHIGFAPAQAAEFIVLTIRRTGGSFWITEQAV